VNLKYIILPLLAFGLAIDLLPANAQPQKVKAIGGIKNMKEVIGAGCSLSPIGSRKTVFWLPFDRSALMNINGKDITLKLVGNPARNSSLSKGDRSSETYRSGKITVKIDWFVTRICQRGDTECESTGYRAKINLKIDDRPIESLNAEGDCGS
jgi:hypothetical protein